MSATEMLPAPSAPVAAPLAIRRISWRLLLAVLGAGVAGGIAGIALAALLHWVQHLAYGYGGGQLISTESFLDGVTAASPPRRGWMMVLCGLLAGGGWWALQRLGRPLVGIERSLRPGGPPLPPLTTLLHAVLQIVTVGLGSPLGREVAPREAAAVLTQRWAVWLGLSAEEQRLAVACAAGAGLAAVYNVSLGGAVFVLETLLCTLSWPVVFSAMLASALAASLASTVLGDGWQYHLPVWPRLPDLLWWSLLAGPLLGLAGEGFARLTHWARQRAPVDGRRLPWSLLVFSLIGLAAMAYPQLLGNGRGPATESFEASLGLGLALVLLLLKVLTVTASLRAGAAGGLLTPSIAVGALFGLVLGQLWNHLGLAPMPGGAFAMVGACAFLAVSRRMPLTAIVLMAEFTHVDYDLLIPMMVAVAGACWARQQCASRPLAAG